jgi:hypothetical protein
MSGNFRLFVRQAKQNKKEKENGKRTIKNDQKRWYYGAH